MAEQERKQSPRTPAPEIEHPEIKEIEHTTAHPDSPRVDNLTERRNRQR